MATKIMLLHPPSGLTKEGHFGFSWTYLFFGPLVPLYRGEISMAVLHVVFSLLSFFLAQIILAFMYNKQHIGCYGEFYPDAPDTIVDLRHPGQKTRDNRIFLRTTDRDYAKYARLGTAVELCV